MQGANTKSKQNIGGLGLEKLNIYANYTETISLNSSLILGVAVGSYGVAGTMLGGVIEGEGDLVIDQGSFEWAGGQSATTIRRQLST